MLDRASIFDDDEIVSTLSRKLVPVAVDEWYHVRRKDAEGDFYRKIVYQREGMNPNSDSTTQGFYVFNPEGKLLRGWNNRDVPKARRYLKEILRSYAAPGKSEVEGKGTDQGFARPLEAGGVVVDVYSRITEASWPRAKDEWERLFRESTGRDHLWILKDEVAELAAGRMPKSLEQRIARFHLVDNTRGEPPFWDRKEVAKVELRLVPEAGGYRLEGEAALATAETAKRQRGHDASLLGRVEAKDGKLTRFDVVSRGLFWGEGTFTPGAPPGKFTLAIAFRLAQGGEADKVPPQGARDIGQYLHPPSKL